MTDSTSNPSTTFAVGDVVDGRYELRRDLGRGAGGMVFEARHRFTQRSVALKVVAPDVPRASLAEHRARLMREARALAAIRHPGIVDVLDGGVAADGTPYVVMEQLEGRTLEGLLAARGKLSREDTVAVALQLCVAVDAAHKAGVVHRDIKPENVFVVRDHDGHERLKLVDFGTAQTPGARDEKLTGIGALIGTPAYMAPEQLLAYDDVNHLADIYALGVTMFECLTGRLPYEGNYPKVLLEACSPTPVPDVAVLCPEAGETLAGVVAKAIAKKREERFASAMDFAQAVYGSIPTPRSRTFFLGPPPTPRFAPASVKEAASAMATQRRRSPRAPYVTPACIVLEDGAEIEGRTEDVSEGGLLVICSKTLELSQRATVRFALPMEGTVVSCKARPRWVRAARPDDPEGPRAIGLELLEVSPELQASIARYVELMAGAS